MTLPEKIEVLIITLSDRAHRGEYEDLSGPRIQEKLSEYFSSVDWDLNIKLTLIPDEASTFKELLLSGSEFYNVVFTVMIAFPLL